MQYLKEKKAFFIISTAFFLFGFIISLSSNAAHAAMGPLKKSTTNPRYFADTSGNAVYLTGSHVWYNFQDRNIPFDYNGYLNLLKSYNHNFIRLWVWELTSCSYPFMNGEYSPHPWQRTGGGTALDGKPKFNLSKFNQAYFDRLRQRVIAARDKGIYVSIMLFEGHGLQADDHHWTHHPFNAANNINGINGDPNGDGYGYEIHRNQIPAVTAIQDAYVKKVIDTVNDLNNVLFEVVNEDGGGTITWQEHVVSTVRNYEKTKPKQHPVGITPRNTWWNFDVAESEVFSSSADWVSPIQSSTDWKSNPPVKDGSKVVISDTDHLWGIGGNRAWVWKTFTRGHNPIFMDPYGYWDNTKYPYNSEAMAIEVRQAMGHTLSYAKQVNMNKMIPQTNTSLCSTGYCLTNPTGGEYIAYIPSGTSITMDLSNSSGNLNVEWFNTVTGETQSGGTIRGGKSVQVFTAPFSDAVLFLKK
jgi:hypothetical protein